MKYKGKYRALFRVHMAKFLILAALIHALPSTTICSISTPIKTSRIHTMFSYFAQFMARLLLREDWFPEQ